MVLFLAMIYHLEKNQIISSKSSIGDIIISGNNQKTKQNIWNSDNQILVNQIKNDIKINLKHDNYLSKSDLKNKSNSIKYTSTNINQLSINLGNNVSIPNNNYSFYFNTNIDQFNINKILSDNTQSSSSFGPIALSIKLNNLYLPSVLKIIDLETLLLQKDNNSLYNSKSQQTYIDSLEDFTNLITKDTNINIHLGLGADKETTNQNDLTIDHTIYWDIPDNNKISSPLELFLFSKSNTNAYASQNEISNIIGFTNKNFRDFNSTVAQNFINFFSS